MKSVTKFLLFLAICATALIVTSCEKEPQGPSQQEIESVLLGKWKLVSLDGKEVVTNHKSVCTYEAGGKSIHSASGYIQMLKNYVWFPKQEMKYSLTGNQANVHRQPSVSFFNSLNLLSLDVLRPFLTAGYFGKGPDRFETSSHEPTSSVAVDRTYSVELYAEGKINVLHEKYGEGSYKDYTFTYAEIKK